MVDDEEPIRDLVRTVLRYEHYAVDVAASGREALAVAAESVFDLVVLDVMLPDLDGFEVQRRLGGDVPVLFLTARDAVEDRVRGLRAGADDYLVKPFSLDELVAAGLAVPSLVRGYLVDRLDADLPRVQIVAAGAATGALPPLDQLDQLDALDGSDGDDESDGGPRPPIDLDGAYVRVYDDAGTLALDRFVDIDETRQRPDLPADPATLPHGRAVTVGRAGSGEAASYPVLVTATPAGTTIVATLPLTDVVVDPAVVYVVPGRSRAAGRYEGPAAIRRATAVLPRAGVADLCSKLTTLVAGDGIVVTFHELAGTVDGEARTVELALRFTVRDGRVAQVSEFGADQYAVDDVFA